MGSRREEARTKTTPKSCTCHVDIREVEKKQDETTRKGVEHRRNGKREGEVEGSRVREGEDRKQRGGGGRRGKEGREAGNDDVVNGTTM